MAYAVTRTKTIDKKRVCVQNQRQTCSQKRMYFLTVYCPRDKLPKAPKSPHLLSRAGRMYGHNQHWLQGPGRGFYTRDNRGELMALLRTRKSPWWNNYITPMEGGISKEGIPKRMISHVFDCYKTNSLELQFTRIWLADKFGPNKLILEKLQFLQ